MNIDKYLKGADEIDSNREYWYVRTDSGKLYDTFKYNNFIALGWNEITTEEIKKSLDNPEFLKKKISSISLRDEKTRIKLTNEEINYSNVIDLNTPSGKLKSSMIINKLQNFYNLKYGDVVVIPSYGSNEFSFGIIDDAKVYLDPKKTLDCDFLKRRKVRWIVHRDFDQLDKNFYTLKKSMHAISSVKEGLADQIDRVMSDLYFKDGFGHYVIRVNKKSDIKAGDLFDLGNNLIKLLKIINERYGLNENIEETIVKINVQSEGSFLLKGRIGNSIIILGMIINSYACSDSKSNYTPNNPQEAAVLDDIKKSVDTLEIAINKRM